MYFLWLVFRGVFYAFLILTFIFCYTIVELVGTDVACEKREHSQSGRRRESESLELDSEIMKVYRGPEWGTS